MKHNNFATYRRSAGHSKFTAQSICIPKQAINQSPSTNAEVVVILKIPRCFTLRSHIALHLTAVRFVHGRLRNSIALHLTAGQ